MRLSWRDAGHPISVTPAAARILRKQRLTCDQAEAVGQGASVPVELDPELLDLLQTLIAKEGIGFVEDALSNHMKANGYSLGDQEPEDLQAQMAKEQVARQNHGTSDRLRRHWMQQDRQTSSLIRDIERRWRGRAA